VAEDTLFSAMMQTPLESIESTILIDGYVKAMLELGNIKTKRGVIRHIEKNVLDELCRLEEYEKCAWLKAKLDKIKARMK
jgi:hypothetical protein